MKYNEAKRGQEVIYGGIEAVIMEPRINNVKISYTQDGFSYDNVVSYDSIELKTKEDESI